MTDTTRAPGAPDLSLAQWSLRTWLDGAVGAAAAARIAALAAADTDRTLQSALIEVVAVGLDRVEAQRAEADPERAVE